MARHNQLPALEVFVPGLALSLSNLYWDSTLPNWRVYPRQNFQVNEHLDVDPEILASGLPAYFQQQKPAAFRIHTLGPTRPRWMAPRCLSHRFFRR